MKTTKYQKGGPVEAMNKVMGKKPSLKKTLDYVKKNGSGYIPSNPATQKPNTESYKSAGTSIKTAKRPDTKYQDGGRTISENAAARKVAKGKGTISKSYPSGPEEKGSYIGYSKEAKKSDSPFRSMKDSKPARPIMKTGGMVNSNAKIAADKTPGSKGVKSGVNPKAAASKVARGKVGGTSASPKTAVPKMAMGGTRPGMAKAGSKKYQTGGPTAEQQIESGARKNYMANAKAKLMGVAAAARKSSGRRGKI
jgi:hypothetical protein